MISTVFETNLPIGEVLRVQKNRMEPNGKPAAARLSIVTGTHGDELEGQYVCYELARRLKASPEFLHGIVDIYPALNPLGIDMSMRLIPKKDLDLNRCFPGNPEGQMTERYAAAIVEDLVGSDMVLDIHASDMFVRELPQVRISREFSDVLMPFAKQMNVDMIWINQTDVVHEATLAHTLNTIGVPTMVVELGLGIRIDRRFGNQIVDGIFKLMSEMGIWTGPVSQTQMPVISSDGEVEFIRSNKAGIFLPSIEHNHYIIPGQVIGLLVNPYTGETCEEIRCKRGGLLFSLRVNPMVYEGSLIARVLSEREGGLL